MCVCCLIGLQTAIPSAQAADPRANKFGYTELPPSRFMEERLNQRTGKKDHVRAMIKYQAMRATMKAREERRKAAQEEARRTGRTPGNAVNEGGIGFIGGIGGITYGTAGEAGKKPEIEADADKNTANAPPPAEKPTVKATPEANPEPEPPSALGTEPVNNDPIGKVGGIGKVGVE